MAGKNTKSGDTEAMNRKELLQAQAHIYSHTFSFINSMSLKCAIELGMPDVIHKNHNKPITFSNLLHEFGIPHSKSAHFRRLMRLLTHSGFFAKQKVHEHNQEEEDEEGYALTPSSKLLLKDHAFNLSGLALIALGPVQQLPWQLLSSWFKSATGSSSSSSDAFETAHGKSFWNYASVHPEFCSLFNATMAGDSSLIANLLVAECKPVFEGLRSIVDVGGGLGILGRAIADAFPHMKCCVLDLPHVVASRQGTQNLEFVGGDMFEFIPSADALLLKYILHDWRDEDCLKILKQCRAAIISKDKGEKVIIIEIVLDVKKGTINELVETKLFMDLHMMFELNGKERSEKEWETLFLEAGFTSYKITPFSSIYSVIEVFP